MFFFFNDTATTEIYTLSLHDALPISFGPLLSDHAASAHRRGGWTRMQGPCDGSTTVSEPGKPAGLHDGDRKSTRLNSSHANISYAVFCLKKKKKRQKNVTRKDNVNTP